MGRQGTHAFKDWMRWAILGNVTYFPLKQPDSPECYFGDFRLCGNVTMNLAGKETDPHDAIMALRKVHRHISQ